MNDVHSQKPKWNALAGVLYVVLIFFVSQMISLMLLSMFLASKHLSVDQMSSYLDGSVIAQFFYILIAESLAIGLVYMFLKWHKSGFASIGLIKPKWRDLGYGLAFVPVYYLVYLITLGIASVLVPSLNINQEQQIGFDNVQGTLELTLTFLSLVILPPLAEEIMARGLLYSSLKKAMPIAGAAVITSLIFAAAHLPEGGAAGPLYVAAIDTFILSLVLVYLREKTGSLWSSITLHSFKNGVAFVLLFVLHIN